MKGKDISAALTELLKKAPITVEFPSDMPTNLVAHLGSEVYVWSEEDQAIYVGRPGIAASVTAVIGVDFGDDSACLEPITRLTVNCNGTKAALINETFVGVVDLTRIARQGDEADVEVVTLNAVETGRGVVAAKWHPLSPSSLFVILRSMGLCAYDVEVSGRSSFDASALVIAKPSHRIYTGVQHGLYSATAPVSFDFGVESWDVFTVYVLLGNTQVVPISNVTPKGCILSAELREALQADDSDAFKHLISSVGFSHKDSQTISAAPEKMIYRQLPVSQYPEHLASDDALDLLVSFVHGYRVVFTVTESAVYVQLLLERGDSKSPPELHSLEKILPASSGISFQEAAFHPSSYTLVLRHSSGVLACQLDYLHKLKANQLEKQDASSSFRELVSLGPSTAFGLVSINLQNFCVFITESGPSVEPFLSTAAAQLGDDGDDFTQNVYMAKIAEAKRKITSILSKVSIPTPRAEGDPKTVLSAEDAMKKIDQLGKFEAEVLGPLSQCCKAVNQIKAYLEKSARTQDRSVAELKRRVQTLKESAQKAEANALDARIAVDELHDTAVQLSIVRDQRMGPLSQQEEAMYVVLAEMRGEVLGLKAEKKQALLQQRARAINTKPLDAAQVVTMRAAIERQSKELDRLERAAFNELAYADLAVKMSAMSS